MAERLEIGPAEFEFLEKTLRLSDYLPVNTLDDLKVQLPSIALMYFADGEEIVKEGETGTDVFLLYEGAVSAKRKRKLLGSKTLGRLEPGTLFGEVSFLAQGPRSATVVASGTAKAFRFGADDMQRLLERDPRFAQRLAALAKERLKKNN